MESLKQLIRSVLAEGVLESETTETSRQVIDQLKLRLSRTAGFVRAFKFSVPPPESLDLKSVDVIVKRGRAAGLMKPIVSGQFVGNTEDLGSNQVEITIEVPKSWAEFDGVSQQLSFVVAELKDILRHEFEHATQTADETGSIPQANTKDPEQLTHYFLAPAEVAGTVTGMYKAAKTTKRDLEDVFQDRLLHVVKLLKDAGANEAEANEVASAVHDAWFKYARNRFPSARL